MTEQTTGSLLIPTLRYRDAYAAIDFLTEAFGFERRLVVPGEDPSSVDHAQLTLGTRMIMLATHHNHGEFDQLMKLPSAAGGCTQALYVVVDDADSHHKRAALAGAKVVMPLADWSHGGRGYTCTDCEGHVWCFGTYDPWAVSH